MKRILILCPYGKEADIMNLLLPFQQAEKAQLWSNEIFAKLLANILPNTNLILRKLLVGKDADYYMLTADDESIPNIFIGPMSRNCDVNNIISYIPEMVDAQEDLVDKVYNYRNNFWTSNDADCTASTEIELLNRIKECLDQEEISTQQLS